MSALIRSLALVGFVAWILAQACSKSESRESSTGGAIKSDDRSTGGGTTDGAATDGNATDGGAAADDGGNGAAGGADDDATVDGGGATTAGDTTDAIGEDENDQGQAQLTGETIETCGAQGKNWIAVVNSGDDPPACGESLVAWCCSREEIKARFPAFAAQLETRFAAVVDDEKHKLYHCSHNGAATAADAKTTFHFAKVVDGRSCYKTVYVTQAVPAATGTGEACPEQVKTADLTIDGPACEGAAEEPAATALTFAGDVSPILAASCAGGACHDAGSTAVDATLQFNDDEGAFKAKATNIKAAIEDATMPPAASGKTLIEGDKKTITDFLNQ